MLTQVEFVKLVIRAVKHAKAQHHPIVYLVEHQYS